MAAAAGSTGPDVCRVTHVGDRLADIVSSPRAIEVKACGQSVHGQNAGAPRWQLSPACEEATIGPTVTTLHTEFRMYCPGSRSLARHHTRSPGAER